MSIITSGKHVVLINSKTGDLKCVKLPRNQLIQLKSLPFTADSLIGQRYGQSYEILKKHRLVCIEEPAVTVIEPTENCGKTNEFIKDDGSTQTLSQNDIAVMKLQGKAGDEIVKSIVENSTSFHEKTEFSKAKWLKKKINKHQPNIISKKPSIRLFCTSPISKLRPDILGKIINNGNLWSGSKVIVAECNDDLITSAVAQRVTKKGKVVQIFDQKLPHIKFSRWLDLSSEHLNSLMYYPVKFLSQLKDKSIDVSDGSEIEDINDEDNEWKKELAKRREKELELELPKYMSVLSTLKTEKFDSLLISASYDPFPVLELIWDSIHPSGTIVIHTHYLSNVLVCADFVHKKGCSELSVVDQWFREITVLPGRTRPDMRMQTGGGFILTCIKLLPGTYQHGSDSVVIEEKPSEKRKSSPDTENILSKKSKPNKTANETIDVINT